MLQTNQEFFFVSHQSFELIDGKFYVTNKFLDIICYFLLFTFQVCSALLPKKNPKVHFEGTPRLVQLIVHPIEVIVDLLNSLL